MKLQTIIDKLVALVEHKLSSREVLVLAFLALLSCAGFLFIIKTLLLPYISVERIKSVGVVNEGMVGTIKTVNPFVSLSQNEEDLSKLLYSGLVRQNADGNYKLDLAQSVTPTVDGLSIAVKILPHATFHDGTQILADDVIFSFESLTNTRADFDQVSVQKIDDKTVEFKLEKPNARFIQELDFPIVKKGMTSLLQNGFVGSGPFKIEDIATDDTGTVSTITLKSYKRSDIPSPYLQQYSLKFYPSEEALVSGVKNKEVDVATGIRNNLLASISDNAQVATSSMTSNYLLFINQTKENTLSLSMVRHFISQSINRNELVQQVFAGYATPFESIQSIATPTQITADDLKKEDITLVGGKLVQEVKKGDEKATSTPLSFTLTTLNTPELVATAEVIKGQLAQVGIEVIVASISKDDLAKTLQDKNYDLFLFGFYAPSADTYYNFFHSSQTIYPKLNIAGYANKKVDNALDTLRINIQEGQVVDQVALATLSENLYKDMPVVFLYNSQFLMIYNKEFKIKLPSNMQNISNRYQFVTDWYVATERVFPWFRDNTLINYLESLTQ